MKVYLVTGVFNAHAGLLLLSNAQAKRRNHVLVKQADKIKSLNLSDEEQSFIAAGDDNPLAIYKLIGSTQFKVGEKIGYDGEVNKVLAQLLTPAADVKASTDDESEIVDEALMNAIIELDPENSAHFSNQGKPEIKILGGLVDRKVTGKERDAAYSVHIERQAELVEAINALDPENDAHWTEENTPSLAVVSDIVDREVGQKECDLAYQVVLASQKSDDE